MNYIDIILILPIVWGAFRGFKRGFLVEIATLVGLIAGIFLAVIGTDILARVLGGLVSWNLMPVQFFSFMIIFVLVMVAITVLAKVIGHALRAVHLNLINRIAGLLAGAAKWAFVLSILMIFVNYLNPHITILSERAREGSLFLEFIEGLIHYIIPMQDFVQLPASLKP